MDMSVDQVPSPMKRFWRTWRRELVRGGVLFGLVLGVGLFIRNIRVHVPDSLGALGSFGDFDWGNGDAGDLFSGNRHVGEPWEYKHAVSPSQHVWIRNTNGPIEVMPGNSDNLEVHAEKSRRHTSPQSVQIIPVPSERGITICAVWEARESRCNDGGDYRMNGVRKNDVAVRFVVHLPRGVPVDASTVNGGLAMTGVSAPVEASTVNGRIGVRTISGPIQASTVNGSIEAIMHSLTGGDVKLTTVNGSVTAGLPRRIDMNIDAETVNGRVETEFPVKISGKISTRHLRGTIGNGGPTLRVTTVNGSITIQESTGDMTPLLAPVAPAAPKTGRPARPTAPPTPRPDR